MQTPLINDYLFYNYFWVLLLSTYNYVTIGAVDYRYFQSRK